jgi:hypothetical protein
VNSIFDRNKVEKSRVVAHGMEKESIHEPQERDRNEHTNAMDNDWLYCFLELT